MLTKIVLQNFKRHRDLTIDFSTGINALRGGNEAGKSSLLHAISYALFGSKALNLPLEQVVTWGEDTKTLKVALTLNIGGDTLTFTRAKSGAEVTKNGTVFCTGQTEVSALAANLLGADVNTASKLLLANQNSIRGALDGGPKELSVLIEHLAGMEIMDKILDAAQERLALGSPTLLEERLKGAEATLEAATQNLPPTPDEFAHKAALAALNDRIAKAEARLPELTKIASESEKAWQDASALYMKRHALEGAVDTAKANVGAAHIQVAALASFKDVVFTDSRPALRQELSEATDFEMRKVAHRFFSGLPTGERYNGTAVEFEAVSGLNAKEKAEVEREIEVVARSMITAKAKRINHDKCDKCGQDVTHLATVIETNRKVDAEVASLTQRDAALHERLEVLSKDYAVFTGVERFARQFNQAVAKVSPFVTLDESTYPATVTWNGSVPGNGPDLDAIKARLNKAEAEVKAIESGKAKLELATEQLTGALNAQAKAQHALDTLVAPDAQAILDLTEAKDNASLNLNAAKGEIILAKDEVTNLVRDYDNAVKMWAMAQSRVEDSRKVIDECKKDLGSLAFNNALVRKLRAIRPLVANRVWSTVLASVSVMFSQIRGEASIITKETSGFRCNGRAVEALSGSTLDALGLAMRVALSKVFLPHSNILILDEVAAGMDSDRTEKMLGFLQGAQIGQCLLVTHEDISSSVADNLIEI